MSDSVTITLVGQDAPLQAVLARSGKAIEGYASKQQVALEGAGKTFTSMGQLATGVLTRLTGEQSKWIDGLGAGSMVIGQTVGAVKGLVSGVEALTKAQLLATITGPAGWIALGAAVLVAAGAFDALGSKVEVVTAMTKEAWDEIMQYTDAEKRRFAALDESIKQAGEFLSVEKLKAERIAETTKALVGQAEAAETLMQHSRDLLSKVSPFKAVGYEKELADIERATTQALQVRSGTSDSASILRALEEQKAALKQKYFGVEPSVAEGFQRRKADLGEWVTTGKITPDEYQRTLVKGKEAAFGAVEKSLVEKYEAAMRLIGSQKFAPEERELRRAQTAKAIFGPDIETPLEKSHEAEAMLNKGFEAGAFGNPKSLQAMAQLGRRIAAVREQYEAAIKGPDRAAARPDTFHAASFVGLEEMYNRIQGAAAGWKEKATDETAKNTKETVRNTGRAAVALEDLLKMGAMKVLPKWGP